MSDRWYLLTCELCWPPIPMPFDSAAERGQWAAKHTEGSGHASWHVEEEPRTTPPSPVIPDRE